MSGCGVHGPGCFGITEECAWIEADIARRHAEGECFSCGAYPPDYCGPCRGENVGLISTLPTLSAPASSPVSGSMSSGGETL